MLSWKHIHPNQKSMRSIIIALACIILLPSCATLFSKSVYPINIDSTPQGKSFTIINREGREVMRGVTPQIVPLKSSSRYFTSEYYTVLFKTDSGKEVRMPITFHVDGWYIAGNLFIGGLLGYLLIDPTYRRHVHR